MSKTVPQIIAEKTNNLFRFLQNTNVTKFHKIPSECPFSPDEIIGIVNAAGMLPPDIVKDVLNDKLDGVDDLVCAVVESGVLEMLPFTIDFNVMLRSFSSEEKKKLMRYAKFYAEIYTKLK